MPLAVAESVEVENNVTWGTWLNGIWDFFRREPKQHNGGGDKSDYDRGVEDALYVIAQHLRHDNGKDEQAVLAELQEIWQTHKE